MNIVINCRTLNKRHGGPKRYLLNVLENLNNIDKKNEYTLIMNQNFSFKFKLGKNFNVKILRSNYSMFYEYFLLPIYLLKNKFDIFYTPDPVYMPFVSIKKKINTIHDLQPYYYKKERGFIENTYNRIMYFLSYLSSNKTIVVSENTLQECFKIIPLSRKKIINCSEGIEKNFKLMKDKRKLKNTKEKYNISEDYIFYIGSLSPRKNILNIIYSFEKVMDKIPHNLYLFGAYSWKDKSVHKLLNKSKFKDRIIIKGFVEEKDLPAIYNLANLFLYPSLYEGFGLPILEAQACGCPVITSNISSMPEVAGKGALLVDPYNVDEIANSILKIINDKKTKGNLIKKGFTNIKRFSWEKTAKNILRVCEEVYNEK
jgi:glycosyltransferase involved in cell wall biosynthesis